MNSTIYDRIPTMTTDELQTVIRLWSGIVSARPETPKHHDYMGRMLIRACLEMEKRNGNSDNQPAAPVQK